MDRLFFAEETAQRERMKALIERLSDEQLSRPMYDGWTVAGVLAHLAFWDVATLYLINQWERAGTPFPVEWDAQDIESINEASRVFCTSLPPRVAAQLAIRMADEVSRRVEAMPEALVAQILSDGQPFNLSRANHRKHHLDDIERHIEM